MIDQLKPLLGKLALFSQERLGFKHPPRLFLRNDSQNSQQALGKTAFYNPQEQSVTLFIHGRHPKDILRSFTHELVHHCQNERGDLTSEKMGEMGSNYAQDNDHMRKMEQEAYLEGSMCFRDWEDTIEDKDLTLIKLAESKFLKENKTMTTKITKEFLKETIRKVLAEQDPVQAAIAGLEKAPELQGTDRELDKEQLKKRFLNTVIAALKSGSAEEMAQAEEMFAKMKAGMAAASTVAKPAPSLEEGGCGSAPGKRCDDKSCSSCYPMEEANELEEAKKCPHCDGDAPKSECICGKVEEAAKPDYIDIDGDGDKEESMKKAAADKEKQEESKIQTPEQENALYESRFAPKNNRLFEKLVKEWTK